MVAVAVCCLEKRRSRNLTQENHGHTLPCAVLCCVSRSHKWKRGKRGDLKSKYFLGIMDE